jgi:hypothetical protein
LAKRSRSFIAIAPCPTPPWPRASPPGVAVI